MPQIKDELRHLYVLLCGSVKTGDQEKVAAALEFISKHLPSGTTLSELLQSYDGDQGTVMHIAAEMGHDKIVHWLVNYSQTKIHPPEGEPANDSAPSIPAAGQPPNLIEVRDNKRRSPLMVAAAAGHADTVTLLLAEAKADVHARDINNQTVLHHAAASQADPIRLAKAIDILCKYKADLEALDADENTPLHTAVSCIHSTIAFHLVTKGSNILARAKGLSLLQRLGVKSANTFTSEELQLREFLITELGKFSQQSDAAITILLTERSHAITHFRGQQRFEELQKIIQILATAVSAESKGDAKADHPALVLAKSEVLFEYLAQVYQETLDSRPLLDLGMEGETKRELSSPESQTIAPTVNLLLNAGASLNRPTGHILHWVLTKWQLSAQMTKWEKAPQSFLDHQYLIVSLLLNHSSQVEGFNLPLLTIQQLLSFSRNSFSLYLGHLITLIRLMVKALQPPIAWGFKEDFAFWQKVVTNVNEVFSVIFASGDLKLRGHDTHLLSLLVQRGENTELVEQLCAARKSLPMHQRDKLPPNSESPLERCVFEPSFRIPYITRVGIDETGTRYIWKAEKNIQILLDAGEPISERAENFSRYKSARTMAVRDKDFEFTYQSQINHTIAARKIEFEKLIAAEKEILKNAATQLTQSVSRDHKAESKAVTTDGQNNHNSPLHAYLNYLELRIAAGGSQADINLRIAIRDRFLKFLREGNLTQAFRTGLAGSELTSSFLYQACHHVGIDKNDDRNPTLLRNLIWPNGVEPKATDPVERERIGVAELENNCKGYFPVQPSSLVATVSNEPASLSEVTSKNDATPAALTPPKTVAPQQMPTATSSVIPANPRVEESKRSPVTTLNASNQSPTESFPSILQNTRPTLQPPLPLPQSSTSVPTTPHQQILSI